MARRDKCARVSAKPRIPCRARGWNCPESFVGPPTAAKIHRFRVAGRPCSPTKLNEVPGGYAALRLEMIAKPRALGAAGKRVVNW